MRLTLSACILYNLIRANQITLTTLALPARPIAMRLYRLLTCALVILAFCNHARATTPLSAKQKCVILTQKALQKHLPFALRNFWVQSQKPAPSQYANFDTNLPSARFLPIEDRVRVRTIAKEFDLRFAEIRAAEMDPHFVDQFQMRSHSFYNAGPRTIRTAAKLLSPTHNEATELGFDPRGFGSAAKGKVLVIDYESASSSGMGTFDPGISHSGAQNFPPLYAVGDFVLGTGHAEGYALAKSYQAPSMGGSMGGRYSDIQQWVLVKASAAEIDVAQNQVRDELRQKLLLMVEPRDTSFTVVTKLRTFLYLDRYAFNDGIRLASTRAPSETLFNRFGFAAGLIQAEDFHANPYLMELNTIYAAPKSAKHTFTIMFHIGNNYNPDAFLLQHLSQQKIKWVDTNKTAQTRAGDSSTMYQYSVTL